MGKKKTLNLTFPVGGLSRVLAHRQQPPYTTPDALNVRPGCVFQKRKRPGSRPGLGKFCYNELGSGNPIRLINEVKVVKSDGATYTADFFEQTELGSSLWSTASWIGTSPGILSEDGALASYPENTGVVRSAVTNLKTTSAYQIELFISPYAGEYHGTYSMYARMNNTTPIATTDGIVVSLTKTGSTGSYTGSLKSYNASTATTYAFTAGSDGSSKAGVLKVLINGINVKVYWNETLLKDQNVTLGASAEHRVGFGLNCTVSGGICFANYFRIQYYSSSFFTQIRKILCASSNGSFYRENTFSGTLAALSTNLSLSGNQLLQSIDRYQKLYIADYDQPRTEQTDGAIDATGLLLTSATVASTFITLGCSQYDDVVVISAGTGGVENGTYKIANVAAATITLASSCGTTGTCSFSIQRAPKIYDPTADTLSIWSATDGKGQVPTGCNILCLYHDRAVFAKDHIYYMGRSGDPFDFDYSQDPNDDLRAVAGQEGDGGQIGDTIRAAIPFGDDFLVWGCEDSIWLLRGDPASGGMNDNISRDTNIVDKSSWCWGPNGELVFLSKSGLNMLASPGSQIKILSEKLPLELQKVNRELFFCQMVYDSNYRGVHIYLTPVNAQNRMHWWFDWDTQSFWPEQIPDDLQPTSVYNYKSGSGIYSLLGCKDGYIRHYKDEYIDDDGTAISSYMFYGPMRIAGNDLFDGLVLALKGYIAQNSGDIDWEIYVGETHEDCMKATVFKSGTWTRQGLNTNKVIRARGGSWALKVKNGSVGPWAIEVVNAIVEELGMQRIHK